MHTNTHADTQTRTTAFRQVAPLLKTQEAADVVVFQTAEEWYLYFIKREM